MFPAFPGINALQLLCSLSVSASPRERGDLGWVRMGAASAVCDSVRLLVIKERADRYPANKANQSTVKALSVAAEFTILDTMLSFEDNNERICTAQSHVPGTC